MFVTTQRERSKFNRTESFDQWFERIKASHAKARSFTVPARHLELLCGCARTPRSPQFIIEKIGNDHGVSYRHKDCPHNGGALN